MEQQNFQRHGRGQKEDSESPQLPQHFMPQNMQSLNLSAHHPLQVQPSSEQAVNTGVHPAMSLQQYHSSAELQTSNYGTLHQPQPQIHHVESQADHDPRLIFQHEQHLLASTGVRPVSEMPSQNIQQSHPSLGLINESHQYIPQQMPTREVQQSLQQEMDMTSQGHDQSIQPFSGQQSYMIARHRFQQWQLPSQHQLLPCQPSAQQETGRLHYGNKGTSSQYLYQGSGLMAQNIQQSEQQILRQPLAHQATDSVKQRKTFKSPEQQLEQHQKSQIPFQYIQQPVSYQQSPSPLQRGTKKRKHQHSHEKIVSQPILSESGQTSTRNFRETFDRVPQSEHSSHHEGVASSSAGSEVPSIDVTIRHGVSMSPLYQKLTNNQAVIEQEAQDKFLKSQCLYRHHIIPDENSLYRAIAESFYGDQSRYNDLREKTVKCVRENLFQSQHASERDPELYAALDRSTEENILSHLLGVSIHVLVGGGDSRIEFHTLSPGNRDTERPIYISWLSIGHYDAVVPNTNHNEVYMKWLEQQICILLQHGKVKEASTHVQSYHISLKGEQCTSDINDTWEDRNKQQRHDEFIELLFRTAQDLRKDELKSLKFLCRNSKSMEILKGEIEDIHHVQDLFQKLLDRKLISADDCRLLADLLRQISRVDLAENISPVKPYNVTESIKWLQKYLQEKYKRHYIDFKPIPWNSDVSLSLTEIYTRLKVIKINKGWRFKQGDTIENELEIFQNKDAELPCRRIAIEGAPAMGKSTFCRKLAYDWACGKLPQFQLLFFLEMRHVSDNKKLPDIIFDQLLPEDSKITKKVLDNYIEQNQNLVLCLFDGLDEMTSISIEKSDIPAIISEKLLTWCTVVTTTRPYELRYSLTNCHAHFKIEGFTTEDAINFIDKYFALMGNQQEAEKLISELNLENVKPPPLPSYPYKVNDDLSRLANYFNRSHRGDDYDKSLQSVDDTTGSHIRYDLLCNPLHLTFVCLLWEERKIIPTSNMTDIYTDILDCVLKRYCCKNDKTLDNGKVPQDVIDEVNRLAHYAYDVCLKDNMMVDEDDLSETVLNLGLLVKDSGISRVKVQRHCFFYHKTWLEYFTALHISNIAHDFVHSSEAEVLNQKQICLFAAGILKEKADPILKQLVKKMQHKYNTLKHDITAEFRFICDCLNEAGIDIDYLAPEMPNHLILGKDVDDRYMSSTLQINYKNTTFGLLNCDTVFVFEQLSNMLCKTKGSATNIKHLYIRNGSADRTLQLIRYLTPISLSLTTLGIQQVSIECLQLLAEALRKGWQLNTLTLSPAPFKCVVDTKGKEKASQAVNDLFKSVSRNKYLETFSWDPSPHMMNIGEGNIQSVMICPLNELVEDGPNYVNLVFINSQYTINAVEIQSFSDSLYEFITKCKKTKKLTVNFYHGAFDICDKIFTKFQQTLKSASSVLASCGILWRELFTTPDRTHNLVEALNTNSNISDFEAIVIDDNSSVSNAVHFIREVKHVKSLTLHIYYPDDFESLITNIELKGVLKHLTLTVLFTDSYFEDKMYIDHQKSNYDNIIFDDLVSPLSNLLSKGKNTSLHSLTVTILAGEKEIVDKVMSMISSHVESKSIVMEQFVTSTTQTMHYLSYFHLPAIVHGVTITIDFFSSNDK